MSTADDPSRTSINFVDLVTEFQGHYHDFDQALKAKSVFDREDNQPVCYVTFGITNAGKVRRIHLDALCVSSAMEH